MNKIIVILIKCKYYAENNGGKEIDTDYWNFYENILCLVFSNRFVNK